MSAWERAVEAMREAWKSWLTNPPTVPGHPHIAADRLEASLLAAAPHLERHFRALFEAELAKRQEKR